MHTNGTHPIALLDGKDPALTLNRDELDAKFLSTLLKHCLQLVNDPYSTKPVKGTPGDYTATQITRLRIRKLMLLADRYLAREDDPFGHEDPFQAANQPDTVRPLTSCQPCEYCFLVYGSNPTAMMRCLNCPCY